MATMFDMNTLITRMEENPSDHTLENAKLLLSYFPQRNFHEAATDLKSDLETMQTESDQILSILNFIQASDLAPDGKDQVQNQLNTLTESFLTKSTQYYTTVATFEEEFGSIERHNDSLKTITDKAAKIFKHYNFTAQDLAFFEGFKAYAQQNYNVCRIIASVPEENRKNFITMAKAFSFSHDRETEKPKISIKDNGTNTLH